MVNVDWDVLQDRLQKLFDYTSDITLGDSTLVPDVKIEAALASAQLAHAIAEVEELRREQQQDS